MYCPKCGNTLPQGAKFCNLCGTAGMERNQVPPVRKEVPVKPEKKEKPKMSKKKKTLIWIISSLSAVLIAAAVLLVLWYLSPEQKMLRALEENNLEEAVEIYNKELDGESEELVQKLTEKLNTVKADFIAVTVDYSSAVAELDRIAAFEVQDVDALLQEVRDYISKLNSSRNTFAEAEALLQEGSYAQAMDKYALVWSEDSNYQAAQSQTEVAKQAYRDEIIAQAKTLSDKADYEGALEKLESGLTVLPDDAQISEKITQTEDSYRTHILAEAKTYADSGLYDEAIAQLNIGLTVLPKDTVLAEQITAYETQKTAQEKSDLLAKAAEYVTNGDYPSAIELLAGHEDDAEINSLYIKYCGEYEKNVLAEADKLIADYDFDGAIAILKAALIILPEDSTLADKLQLIEKNKPVALTSIHVIDSRFYETGSGSDTFGNSYANTISIGSYNYYDGYVLYNLDGKYDTLRFTIAASSFINGYKYDDPEEIRIYADDVLIYNKKLDLTTPPEIVTLEIPDCKVLKIERANERNRGNQLPLIAEPIVFKMNMG